MHARGHVTKCMFVDVSRNACPWPCHEMWHVVMSRNACPRPCHEIHTHGYVTKCKPVAMSQNAARCNVTKCCQLEFHEMKPMAMSLNPSRDHVTKCCPWPCHKMLPVGMSFWHVGICYRSMARKGSGTDSKLGCNKASWTVELHGKLSAWHKNVCTRLEVSTQPVKLGVHLNYDAGTLTFLNVSDKQTHLHTFRARFTEPVYPAFWIQSGTATSWITVRSTTDRDFRTYANIN
ncbi:UNVERIFIED_CONTAM: hypothetical protein FKN15_060818 [Acipenser sinensis]